jgi:hypothetical protein
MPRANATPRNHPVTARTKARPRPVAIQRRAIGVGLATLDQHLPLVMTQPVANRRRNPNRRSNIRPRMHASTSNSAPPAASSSRRAPPHGRTPPRSPARPPQIKVVLTIVGPPSVQDSLDPQWTPSLSPARAIAV